MLDNASAKVRGFEFPCVGIEGAFILFGRTIFEFVAAQKTVFLGYCTCLARDLKSSAAACCCHRFCYFCCSLIKIYTGVRRENTAARLCQGRPGVDLWKREGKDDNGVVCVIGGT